MLAAITSTLAKPAVKYGLAALAALALVGGALWYVHSVREAGRAEGSAQTQIVVQQKTIETQRKINDAEAKGPRTKSDAVRRLRDGTF
jgi:uncharacterized membrane-anchored protein